MFGFGKKKDLSAPVAEFNIGDHVDIYRNWEKPIGHGKVENRQIYCLASSQRFGSVYRYSYMVNGQEYTGDELKLKTTVDQKSTETPSDSSAPSITQLIEHLAFACVSKSGHTVNLEIRLPKPILDSLDLGDKPLVTGTAQNGAHKTYHISGGTVTFK